MMEVDISDVILSSPQAPPPPDLTALPPTGDKVQEGCSACGSEQAGGPLLPASPDLPSTSSGLPTSSGLSPKWWMCGRRRNSLDLSTETLNKKGPSSSSSLKNRLRGKSRSEKRSAAGETASAPTSPSPSVSDCSLSSVHPELRGEESVPDSDSDRRSTCGRSDGSELSFTPSTPTTDDPRVPLLPRDSSSSLTCAVVAAGSPMRRTPHSGPYLKLVQEGEVAICRLNHTRTIISKILNSKYLRRWEWHRLALQHDGLTSATPTGFLERGVKYSEMEDVSMVSRWDSGQRFCLRITLQDGSLLLQANSAHIRDQWLHSILWKRHMYKSEQVLRSARRPEVLLKEMKSLVEQALMSPIQDESICQFPLDLVSQLLLQKEDVLSPSDSEQMIYTLHPLLENNNPRQEICDFFTKHCRNNPRSQTVVELFTPVVQRILKHYTVRDFGKFPRNRIFVAEYFAAINSQNGGPEVVRKFVQDMHRPVPSCPHPRVLHNLVAVCLAAIYSLFEERKTKTKNNMMQSQFDEGEWESRLRCFSAIIETMSAYDDWRIQLAGLLQPIPFPDEALQCPLFTTHLQSTIRVISGDERCDVHRCVLPIREGKEGWFHLYCPGGYACDDEGALFSVMLKTLLSCCCRRRKFLTSVRKIIGPCIMLALGQDQPAMETLCAFLELDVVESSEVEMKVITALQTTPVGKMLYTQLCERQIAVREMQQEGGPRKLTLPSKSTDEDLTKLLSSGSFGNLECLSLAFTQVTSGCAFDLIKLPSLRYLNLWSTQFGDRGLEVISEHLTRLQVLNLCETPVTDKGLSCLSGLKNLRKLNLNSTGLSALTFEGLKEKLPCLQECDIRYTDAW